MMIKKENMTEAELVQQCINGNRSCQEMFYRKYASKMYGVCLGYVNNRDDAKDIMQEGFIKVFSSLKSYTATGSLEGWVRRIIVNTAIDYYRKTLKYKETEDIENVGDVEVEISVLERIEVAELMELIHKLPKGARIIFNLYAIEGYQHNEIASMLGISQGTSKSQFSRARALLKEWVNQLYPQYLKKVFSPINSSKNENE